METERERYVRMLTPHVKRWAARWPARNRGSLEVSDLVQVGMIAVLKALETFRPERGNVVSWVFRPARRAMSDLVRKQRADVHPPDAARRNPGGFEPLHCESIDAAPVDVVTEEPSPEEQAIGSAMVESVRVAVGRLPPGEREVIRAVYGIEREPWPIRQCAVAFNVSRQAIAARQRAALGELRRALT